MPMSSLRLWRGQASDLGALWDQMGAILTCQSIWPATRTKTGRASARSPHADDEVNRALIRRTTVRLTCSRGSPLDLSVRGDSLRAFLAALA